MADSGFTVYKRKSHDRATRKAVTRYVARFLDEEGRIARTQTLKARSSGAARSEASKMLAEGRASDDPLALEFLLDFWRIDSDYAKMKALRGRPLSYHYVEINTYAIKKHLSGPLRDVRLHQVTVPFMERLVLNLAAAKVGPRVINTIIQSIRVPIADRARKGRYPDPLQYLQKVAEHPRQRGTLTADELARVITLEGESPRIKAAVLLGALCGLRMGEIRGLEWGDVDEGSGVIHVRHNWVNDDEKLKGPKCGSERTVMLPAPVLKVLNLCKQIAPEKATFALFNEKSPARPMTARALEVGLARILVEVGIDRATQKDRNITLHALRHTFVSLSRAAGLPDFAVMRLAGHKSLQMTERYSHAENVVDFAAAKAKLEEAVARVDIKAAGGHE